MPTLQAILADIDERLPNPFAEATKINWLNNVQREVFRDLAKKEILEFDTIAGTPIYDISEPVTGNLIEFDLIGSVTVDNVKYDPADLNDAVRNNIYFKVLDGKMGIYPTPSKDGSKVRIFYEKRPRELSASNLTAIPDLREDYQDILKYGVMQIIAESRDDITKANNYAIRFNALMDEIKQKKYEQMSKYPATKNVLPSRRRYVSEVV